MEEEQETETQVYTREDVKRRLQEYRQRDELASRFKKKSDERSSRFKKKYFHEALTNKDYEFAKALIALGFEDVDDEEGNFEIKPMFTAIAYGNLDMVQFLIHRGVSQTERVVKSKLGEISALMCNSLVDVDQVDIARELVLAGCDPEFESRIHIKHPARTAADIAYFKCNFEVLAYFKSIGCNVHDFYSVYGFNRSKGNFISKHASPFVSCKDYIADTCISIQI